MTNLWAGRATGDARDWSQGDTVVEDYRRRAYKDKLRILDDYEQGQEFLKTLPCRIEAAPRPTLTSSIRFGPAERHRGAAQPR